MQLINKIFKFNILILTLLCFISFAIEIDPVEIGKKYLEDLEINLSIIENLRKEYKNEEIKIKKDVRRKIKEKENVIKKNNEIQKKEIQKQEVKLDNKNKLNTYKENNSSRIKKSNNKITNELQIFFESNSANIRDDEKNKIQKFINNQKEKDNLSFKVTSYAKTNNGNDNSRRLSLDRAINVRTILLNEGVPAKNLIVKSFGDTKNKENKVIIKFEKK